jgi:tetratricopeptide (TPR) repeat protein
MQQREDDAFPRRRRDWLAATTLAGLALAVFWPALNCDFINFDDPEYVSKNPRVASGLTLDGVRWACTSSVCANWHPLTILSLQLDATLWKPADGKAADPRGFHLTNVLFHVGSAVLLFGALRVMTGAFWRSFAVAALFTVHPLRVESVAWVAERKDVLSTFFGIAALLVYGFYARRPSVARYLAVAAALLLSLLSKPMLVTLPFLLLVLDWWPLARAAEPGSWRRLAMEKVPLVALALVISFVAYAVQSAAGAMWGAAAVAPADRVGNAIVSYVAYLGKTVWPAGLAIMYPHRAYPWGSGLSFIKVAVAALALIAITAGAVSLRRRAPYLLTGWLWYTGTLVPVIGLIQVGDQAYADRYMYFPQIGILLTVCWAVAELSGGRAGVALAAAVACTVALAVVTHEQLKYWHDSLTLWDHTLATAGPSPTALISRAEVMLEQGRLDAAADCLEQSLRLEPESPRALNNLGFLFLCQDKIDKAEPCLEKVCKRWPDFPTARMNLGQIRFRQGRYEEADALYHEAARLYEKREGQNTERAELGFYQGQIAALRGDPAKAAECFREALRFRPDHVLAHTGLADTLLRTGRTDEAIGHLRAAVTYSPRFGRGHLLLGIALEASGDLSGASQQLEEATHYSPEFGMAWYRLGLLRRREGRTAESVECLSKAVEREPKSARFHGSLAEALNALASEQARAGRSAEALATVRRARQEAASAARPDLIRQIEEQQARYERGQSDPVPTVGPGASDGTGSKR